VYIPVIVLALQDVVIVSLLLC